MTRAMKDSGAEWIGAIPAEWHFTKVFNCLSMPITDGPHTTPELFDNGIVFISAEAVSCGNGRIDFSHKRGYISKEFYEECCKKYIPQIDDIYMIKSGATTGRVSIVDTLEPMFTIWSPLAVFRCNKNMMLPQYLYYELQSEGFQKQVEFGWTFGTQQNIGMRTLEQLKVCVPTIKEQHRIADFLDKRCAEIDRVIDATQQTIAEYKALKQSIITEAVTKGVRGPRPMKNSGVEWIGEIAEDFELKKLKHLCHILDQFRSPITADQRNQDATVLYDYYGASGAIDKIDGYTIDDHVMLIGEDGANLRMRNLPLMYEVKGKAWINNHAHILKPKENVDFYYLFYALEGLDLNTYITGSAQPKLSQENLRRIWIPIPSYDEQKEIANHIKTSLTELNRVISIKQEFLAELENYKKSVIYEYVTGKKEAPAC